MKGFRVSERVARRLLAGAGAVAITAALSGVALAADATANSTPNAASTVIKGCYNPTSGALRVRTPHSNSCGSERQISWNQTGRAGIGYAFRTTTGTINNFGGQESDGPVVTKKGTYFVNVTARLNIAAYTTGGAGFCALDLAHGTAPTTYVFDIFSAWGYPGPATAVNGAYPFGASGMIHVAAKRKGYQFILACFNNTFNTVPVMSATWLVSPVSAKTSATASSGHSTLGPAGVRPKPALKP